MFTVLLGKPNRLFHQNRSQDWTLISVLLNAVLTVSLIFIFFIVRDIKSDYHQHLTRWLIYVSCALNFVAVKCWENCTTHIYSPQNWRPALCTSNPLAEICFGFFLNICVPFPFETKKIERLLDFDEVSAILQALHIRALLSRSSREMKFESSSWNVKAGLLHFC